MNGKDLTRIPMALLFHQPLYALQFFATSFEYFEILKEAARAENSYKDWQILLLSPQSEIFQSCRMRNFTPEYKVISEQVCHHGPITVVHCESKDFVFSITMKATVGFSGTSIIAKLPAETKKTNEFRTYSFSNMIVKILLFGKIYFEQVGEAIYTNRTTGDIGILTFKEKLNDYLLKATIKDQNGNIRCQISGYFGKEVYANNELFWNRNSVDTKSKWYYFFFQIIFYILRVPQTDCKMRSDMNAFEFGFKDLGQEEKVRIEVKQRERERENYGRKEPLTWSQILQGRN